jgi:hypothetical protein
MQSRIRKVSAGNMGLVSVPEDILEYGNLNVGLGFMRY